MRDRKVVIVDYQLGNMFSVRQACRKVGMNVITSSEYREVRDAAALVIPGVGAFGEAVQHLKRLNLFDTIKQCVADGKPVFGVCLGLQLLLSRSDEFGEHQGLDLIPGRVIGFPRQVIGGRQIRIPQVGWNQIYPKENTFSESSLWSETSLSSCSPGDYFYFVHSFVGVPDNDENILCRTQYGGYDYVSGLVSGNRIVATQFHPEKSGEQGLRIYENWARTHNLIE